MNEKLPCRVVMQTVSQLCVLLFASATCRATEDAPLADKTLVVWASPANLTQAGGTALTVNDTTIDRFDGVVFAELEPQVWMPGSNGYSRTKQSRPIGPRRPPRRTSSCRWPSSTEASRSRCIAMASCTRSTPRAAQPYAFGTQYGHPVRPATSVQRRGLLLRAHPRRPRLRPPLDQATIAAMQPGEPVDGIEPWAWWDFADDRHLRQGRAIQPGPTLRRREDRGRMPRARR